MNLLHRRRLRVFGIVQGVGFRPFVARLASDLHLSGWVQNTTSAVVIELEGSSSDAVSAFGLRLERELPAAATIEHVESEEIEPTGSNGFSIVESAINSEYSAGLPPDLAMCADCRRELEDPNDRRFHYPFLNCTACGPRYSIVEALPYDRSRTSMCEFPMCEACRAEYEDPLDRRYHAQPIACPACGPQLSMPIEDAIQALRAGQVGAIRGIGGFHLACDARNPAAVRLLRTRKARGDQPFALMVRDIETARQFVTVNEQAESLLTSPAAPILLLPKNGPAGDLLAPGNGYIGVMLAYSPLHHLLLNLDAQLDALVMTSGNRHGEPIVTKNQQALRDLSALADFVLLHNREIVAACDDSVVRLYRGRALAIRRSRGYAPLSMRLPAGVTCGPTLATGADLKAAFGLADGNLVYISPHIGDMENVETIESMERTLRHLSRLYQLNPQTVVHDRHPGYLSTQWALRSGLRPVAVQHHKAHAASVAAEYGLLPETPMIAVVFDGTGYGDDGAIWGGEFFTGTISQLQRTVHLPYVALPGGDASAKRPSLCALAHLWAAGIDSESVAGLSAAELRIVRQQLRRGVNCHPTSSMGRLFDAAASLLGIRHTVAYEAQAAIEMEAIAATHLRDEHYSANAWDLPELWREMLADSSSERPARARRFTGTIGQWTCNTVRHLAEETGFSKIVLSGGVFQNVLLLDHVTRQLEGGGGLQVYVPRYLPPNDGGIALGQLYLAALQS